MLSGVTFKVFFDEIYKIKTVHRLIMNLFIISASEDMFVKIGF